MFLTLSGGLVGDDSLPPVVTFTVKEATMEKVKLIAYECFTGKQSF